MVSIRMTMMMTVVAVVVVMNGGQVAGQSGPVTTDPTAARLGEDYFYDDGQTQGGGTGTGNTNNNSGSNTNQGGGVDTPEEPTPSQTSQTQTGEQGNNQGQHAGNGLFFPVYNPAGKVNPGLISEDYWDGAANPRNMGMVPPPFKIGASPGGGFPWSAPGFRRPPITVGGGGGGVMPGPQWGPIQRKGGPAWWGGEDGGRGWGMWGEDDMGAMRGPGMMGAMGGVGLGGRGYNFPYGGEYEADEGYWYNGTFHYGGGEWMEDGGGFWHNGTYHYYGGGDEWEGGGEMEDGYWYNGTFYPGWEMDEMWGYENEFYEDGYWYNGTYHYLPDFEDGYWYNGTFHYVPEMDDGYWFNGTFRYLPEYDEGYWYNGTFYYSPEMEMGEMGEGMEDGFYYNGSYYPGDTEDMGWGGYGDGEMEGMEMDEGNNLMWWQRHHPRWRDRTNDALAQPGGMGGIGVGWNSYVPGMKPPSIPGQGPNQYGPFPVFPHQQMVRPPNLPPGQQLPPPYNAPFRGYPPFQQQLPIPPYFGTQKKVGQGEKGIQINQRTDNPKPNDQQQPPQQPPPPNSWPIPQRQPAAQPSPNKEYIEKNPMAAAMTDEGKRPNIPVNKNNNNNKNDRSKILGALGMGAISASAAGMGAATGGSAGDAKSRLMSSRRRRPPMPNMDRLSHARGGGRAGRPKSRRQMYEEMRRGRRIPGRRRRLRKPGEKFSRNGRRFGLRTGVMGGRNGGKFGDGRGIGGRAGGRVGQSPLSTKQDAVNGNRKAMSAMPGNEGTLVTQLKMAANNQQNPTVTRTKASSPLDPYRQSPTSTLGILFASILGFLLIVSPIACLVHKYRQTKKAKKRTFLRRPELGSVDEGIMDAMVRTELGGAKGGDYDEDGRGKGHKSKGRGLERSDIVQMEEVVRSNSGKSRFGGSVGCWGDKEGKKQSGKGKRVDFNREGGQRDVIVRQDDNKEGSRSFSRRHEEMRRMVREEASSRYDEEMREEEEEGEEERRMRRMKLREERKGGKSAEKKGTRRPYTVVGLMSENDDAEIV